MTGVQTCALPIFTKDEVTISVKDNEDNTKTLTISGKKEAEKKDDTVKYLLRELKHSYFERSFVINNYSEYDFVENVIIDSDKYYDYFTNNPSTQLISKYSINLLNKVSIQSTTTATFNDGSTVTKSMSVGAISIYDYENKLNESKRNIKVMNSNYVPSAEKQLQNLMR